MSFGAGVVMLVKPGDSVVAGEPMLELYAEKFTSVEINATYYRIPPPTTMAIWMPRE